MLINIENVLSQPCNCPFRVLFLLDQRSHSASGWDPEAHPDPFHGGSRPSPWATAVCLILCSYLMLSLGLKVALECVLKQECQCYSSVDSLK